MSNTLRIALKTAAGVLIGSFGAAVIGYAVLVFSFSDGGSAFLGATMKDFFAATASIGRAVGIQAPLLAAFAPIPVIGGLIGGGIAYYRARKRESQGRDS